jgi:hypothetical protein
MKKREKTLLGKLQRDKDSLSIFVSNPEYFYVISCLFCFDTNIIHAHML